MNEEGSITEVLQMLFDLFGSMLNWAGAIVLVSLLLGITVPLIFSNTEEVNVRIGIGWVTFAHVTKDENGVLRITFFHSH